MSGQGDLERRIGRRGFIFNAAAGAVALGGLAAPAARANGRKGLGGRPQLTSGVQSGDVTSRGAIVWARADRPAEMYVEISPTESFRHSRLVRGPLASEATDFTAQVDLGALPRSDEFFYRVAFAEPRRPRELGEAEVGRFQTAPSRGAEPPSKATRDVRFVWGGDTAGQGWGINPEFGGMRMYETMRRRQPDFFLHSGDTIYADGPILPEVTLPDGSVWRNVTIEEKSKVAETLAEFRGNHRYNLLDDNVRRFNAEVPNIAQWDDHEVSNNWYPGEQLDDPRYTVRDANLLAARGNQAFHEYWPIRQRRRELGRVYRQIAYGPSLDVFVIDMRTHRGPNSANTQTEQGEDAAILGRAQLDWLKRELERSRATWKVIASDMPIGLIVRDGATAFEAVAQGDGPALGRELEIAELLTHIKQARIRNTVWLTADVHFAAAQYYDPEKAQYQDFDPFWEFVTGPLHAGSFPPGSLDNTFGPQQRFVKGPTSRNVPPSAGLQFAGEVQIDGASNEMTVSIFDLAGDVLYEVGLSPQGA
ncbi:MAG: alkaline phosphatase D family protein [Actinomycetota bacterium]|nr:alkaline phosphatase D family protein [Actinomycetota bacterium]